MARDQVAVDGAKIRRLREERMLQRKELAELVGVTANRLYVIEQRSNSTSKPTARKLARALGVEARVIVRPSEN